MYSFILIVITWFYLIFIRLVGLYDESNEGGKRFLVKGGALIAIPEVYKNSADVELYVKNKEDNWAALLKYSTMGQEEERYYFIK